MSVHVCARSSPVSTNADKRAHDADMAQLVEQRIRNAWVAGSSPAIGSSLVFLIIVSKEALWIVSLR